jgi:heme/copper-type cytochrome/quinol oxidase subunit 1
MTRHCVFSLARTIGHCSWWAFVVATLFAGGIARTRGEWGWTAYTPLTESPVAVTSFGSYDPWTGLEVWSVIAFVVVLIAAAVEAVAARQVVPGVVTVAAPCVAFGLLLLGTPGVLDIVRFGTMQTLCVVLVAVAVREVWARRFAPRPTTEVAETP